MPGNDAGDRIHNFFGQDSSAQGQPRSQVADRNWPALTNNPWAGSQRQIVSPLFSNLKSHNVQQTAELESGHGGQPSSMQHGMNFSQSNLRADFSRNHSQGQQPTVNGYMHGHKFFHVRQNEANFLGGGAESDRQNLSSQGFSVNSALDSQQGNGPELHRKNSVRMDLTESPVNYDFFGNQQMSGQHASMMQTLQRQQSGVADMQMLQQQLMLNQIQEMQRQQQYQKQQQASQLNGMNQVSSFAKQAAGNQSMAMINGIPIHDASNFAWQPELMAANANWPQRGTASFVPGSSGGLMLSPDQSQVHLMGMTPQQVDQSLRGVPLSGSRASSSQFSPIQVDKPTTQQISGASTSFQGNQYTGFSDQISMHDSRQGYQGKNMIGTTVDGQGINSGFDLENMHPVNPQPSNTRGQEFNSRLDTVYPSDKSQDKSMMQGAPSQSAATLDPTEEKILFGSDDNLWDAFGKGNNMGSMGCSVSDGTDIGAFSSLQSGSWSALMQSAVAETSGGNVGSQEEWSGLTFQNNGYSATNQQTQTTTVSGKNQPTWVHSSLQNPSPDTAVSYNNVPVRKQSGVTTLLEQNERLQDESSQRFPGEAAKRLDSGLPQKLVADRGHIFGKPYSSSDAGSNSKSITSHWTNQQSMPSYNAGGQPGNRPNGFNFLDSVSTGMNAVKNQQNEQSLQGSQSINQKGPMFEAAGSGPDVWKSDHLSNSAVNLEREIASPEFKAVDSNVNAVSASPSSNIARANRVSSQQIPNSNNIDIWKRVDSSRIPQGSDVTSNLQYVTDKRQQNIDLSGDNTLANGTIETHETPNLKTKTSTIDGFYNIAQNAAAVGVKENSWLDTSDSQAIPGGKPKSSGNIVRKPPARKFQYHPMGDVDVEPPYASKNATHSQPTLHQISQGSKGDDQGYTFPNQIDRSSMGSEKDPFSGFQEEPKGLRGTSSTSVLPGSAASTSTPIERAVNNHTPNRITPSSQNMLELFHKVDQSREHGNATQYSSLGYNQLEPKNSDGSVQQRSQPSGSQGFNLQLGPPSQILPVRDHAFSSQGNLQKSNSMNSSYVASGVGEKGHNWFASTSSAQSLPPSREASQGELRNDVADSSGRVGNNAQVNLDAALSSNFPFPRRHFPNQHMNETGQQPTASPSVHTSFDSYNSQPKRIRESSGRAETSHSTLASVRDISGKAPHNNIASSTEMHHLGMDNQKHKGDSAQQFPVLEATQVPQHYTMLSMSQSSDSSTKSPPVWTSVPPRQNSFGAQQLKTPSNFLKSSHHSDKTSETTLFQPSKREDQSAQKGGTVQSVSGQFSENSQGLTGRDQPAKGEPCQQVLQEKNSAQTTTSALQGKEHFTSSSLSNPSSSQRDMEAFGRSLRPNDTIHQNYSLLNQMQGMKNAELDPGNRSLKRFRSLDGAVDAQLIASQGGQQLYGHNKVVGESLTNQASALPGDLRNVNLTAESADDQDTNASPQDMVAFGRNDSEGSNLASVRGEHSRISPQMAPSWFDRYGTFKNGQVLPTYDPRKAAILKAMEMASTSGRLPDAAHGHSATEQRAAATPDAPQHGIVQKSLNAASLASENPSSQLRSEAANTSLVVVPAKKRKSASSDLVPWHKEVMHGPWKLQNISTAEVDWAQALNHLPEKVGFEAVMIEDGQPVLRSKRRLILTTQLLQLLLCPPSFSVLSAEAILHHQSIIQCIARATLGDACSALSFTRGDAIVPSNGGNLISEKLKTSERISDQFFSKVMEDLINRAKKLEDDVLRLDKRASILDLRVECQDIEKFSVINRFAKFHGHGRGQPEAAEASSSSDASTNALRVYPQRYVTALPMPRYLPDNVQCLSL